MKKLILIKDNDRDSQNYSKVIIPFSKDVQETIGSNILLHSLEDSNDISELLINQLIASTITDKGATNVYIVSSNNLVLRTNMYSVSTIRHFVNKGREHGDLFLYTGNDKLSKLIARLWGFRQFKLSHNNVLHG